MKNVGVKRQTEALQVNMGIICPINGCLPFLNEFATTNLPP
jgi:hypothetical protein